MKKIIDDYYDKASETNNIIVGSDKYVLFSKVFKYLGSWVTYEWNDNHDTSQRIKKTNQAMDALIYFWKADSVDFHTK